jgi:hypothetical protein
MWAVHRGRRAVLLTKVSVTVYVELHIAEKVRIAVI